MGEMEPGLCPGVGLGEDKSGRRAGREESSTRPDVELWLLTRAMTVAPAPAQATMNKI